MDKYVKLFEYFRQCPKLTNLMSIAATAEKDNTVIFPQGSSTSYNYQEWNDVTGIYCCEKTPMPSVYEDFQINCYEWYDVKDTSRPEYNSNVLTYQDVCDICNWVEQQDEKGNYPDIGEQIVSIECVPFVPQIRYVDADTNTVGYFITVRIRYVNRRKGKAIEYER